ncbi:MAG: DUF2284 domain-containing protein, partial [Nitrospinae bacterium]|nr:DUF2284 domain-containing protein [Nitrospinota bacterium]
PPKPAINRRRENVVTDLRHFKKSPKSEPSNMELVEEAVSLGCVKAKVILTKTISLGRWVKLQCQYGCPFYGMRFTCPPCSPNADEMSEILLDYQKAILIQAPQAKQALEIVLALEERYKNKGFHKAFALCATPCDLCETCTIETRCQHPDKARPTMQACGIDVSQTTFNNGWESNGGQTPCSESRPFGMVLIH